MNMHSSPSTPAPAPLRPSEEAPGLFERVLPSAASNILLWSIAGFFVLFVIWAALTKLDRTVHANGRVVPTASLQQISNLEGGIVSAILVKQGAYVTAGTPLIQLDKTASTAEFGSGQAAVAALAAKVARLEAEVSGRAPNFPTASDATSAEQIGIERALYQSRQADFASLTSAASARILQAERAQAEAEANVAAGRAQRNAAQQNVDTYRPLVEKGLEPRLQLIQYQRQLEVAASQLASATAAVARAAAGIAEARAAYAQQRQDWRSRAADELATARAEIAARRQTLPALQDRVTRTVIRAPLSGRVNRLLIHTVGGSVRPGEPLVEIVPSDSGLTIEAALRPKDVAFVRAGQRALIKISAYDYSVYGGLEGSVIGISPDAIYNDAAKETFYNVRIRTSGTLKDQQGRPLEIGSGMVADVNLLGEKRSVLSYILTPISHLSENAFREQ